MYIIVLSQMHRTTSGTARGNEFQDTLTRKAQRFLAILLCLSVFHNGRFDQRLIGFLLRVVMSKALVLRIVVVVVVVVVVDVVVVVFLVSLIFCIFWLRDTNIFLDKTCS